MKKQALELAFPDIIYFSLLFCLFRSFRFYILLSRFNFDRFRLSGFGRSFERASLVFQEHGPPHLVADLFAALRRMKRAWRGGPWSGGGIRSRRSSANREGKSFDSDAVNDFSNRERGAGFAAVFPGEDDALKSLEADFSFVFLDLSARRATYRRDGCPAFAFRPRLRE